MSITNETYVPLSRGILEHFPSLPPLSFKIYVFLLIKAEFIGKNKGKYKIPISDIANLMGVHYQTVWKCIKKDLENKFITVKPGKNQYCSTIFTILKYKTVQDFIKSALSAQVESNTKGDTESEFKARLKATLKAGREQTQEPQQNHEDTATQELKNLRTKELKKDIKDICDFWNEQKIKFHRLFDKYLPNIKAKLKLYSLEEIIEAITNYKMVLDSPEHWLTKNWTLGQFLTRDTGFENFLSVNNPWENYKIKPRNQQKTQLPPMTEEELNAL